jgi:hypothetical protein
MHQNILKYVLYKTRSQNASLPKLFENCTSRSRTCSLFPTALLETQLRHISTTIGILIPQVAKLDGIFVDDRKFMRFSLN